MKRIFSVIAFLSASAILLWVGYILWIKPQPDTQAINPPPAKRIDPETILAYEKLGAQFGGFVKDDPLFRPGPENAEKGVPAFQFPFNFAMTKLPDVAVLFGLDIGQREITDANLKEIAGLKNLSILSLWHTQVKDGGGKPRCPARDRTGIGRWAPR
jgi:hypothetical protein